MVEAVRDTSRPSRASGLAGAFSFLGWTGFWLQVVFGSFPILVMIYYLAFSRARDTSRSGLVFVEYLTIADLLILLFTTYWSYRYTRIARQLRDPERQPSERSIIRTVWTGVVASAIGMLFSMIVLLVEAANLLFYFLKAPQGGIPVIQTAGAESIHWVSAVDMVSLLALVFSLFAELVVLMLSLWLLFRVSPGSPELPQAGDDTTKEHRPG